MGDSFEAISERLMLVVVRCLSTGARSHRLEGNEAGRSPDLFGREGVDTTAADCHRVSDDFFDEVRRTGAIGRVIGAHEVNGLSTTTST